MRLAEYDNFQLISFKSNFNFFCELYLLLFRKTKYE
jgi:hypothetical protein